MIAISERALSDDITAHGEEAHGTIISQVLKAHSYYMVIYMSYQAMHSAKGTGSPVHLKRGGIDAYSTFSYAPGVRSLSKIFADTDRSGP